MTEVKGKRMIQPFDAEGNRIKPKKGKYIAPENVMIMELIDRFQPTRLISIHGTKSKRSAGVFSDPHYISRSEQAVLESKAESMPRPSHRSC